MSGLSKLLSRLSLSKAVFRLDPKYNALKLKNPLGVSTTFSPRTFLQLQHKSQYSSWDNDDRRNSNFDAYPNEFPVFQQRRKEYWDEDNEFQDDYRPKRRITRPPSRYNKNKPRQSSYYEEDDDDFFQDNFSRRSSSQLGENIKKKDWTTSNLPSIEKNFYVLHPDVAEKSNESTEEFYAKHNITVSRGEPPVPLCDFHEANFPEKIVHYLERNQWSNPTPIQSLGWPMALSGKNMVGLAQTGSGKTLGFILPALVHIKHQRPIDRGEGPIVLVLAPTRELAQQIRSVAVEYGRLLGIRSCSIFGGQSKMTQARQISQGPELVVATPGRLLDFLETEVINLDRTTYVVLDEADRMLDMGFEPQIRKVLDQIRPDRQILMWSATWPQEIQQLAHDFLGEFTQVNIGSQELTANPNIQQIVKVCERREKFGMLLHEFDTQRRSSEDNRIPKTLIFGQTKITVDIITEKLRSRRFRVRAIHGDKSQIQRDNTLNSFREGNTDILVATDVAARGLDVNDIKLVVNYDYPNAIDDYIHRIGRTGRASKTGTAISFITDNDAGKVKDLISTLKAAGQEVDPELYDLSRLQAKFSKKSSKPRYGNSRGHRNNYNNYNRYDDRYSR